MRIVLLVALLAIAGCGPGEDTSSDRDGDTGADADADAETGADTGSSVTAPPSKKQYLCNRTLYHQGVSPVSSFGGPWCASSSAEARATDQAACDAKIPSTSTCQTTSCTETGPC